MSSSVGERHKWKLPLWIQVLLTVIGLRKFLSVAEVRFAPDEEEEVTGELLPFECEMSPQV